ncbi:MAG: hypothetical protein BIFFINMI_02741 [Phycisphaerae bacterium]|nr:hypothetical protein [Phycisphaerae bacterium]
MNTIDFQRLADRVREAVAAARPHVRYAEVRLERHDATVVRFSGPHLDAAGRSFDAGGSVRVLLAGGGWGVASFNGLEDIPQRIRAARDCAAVQDGDPLPLADVPPTVDLVVRHVEEDFREVPLAEKVERMRGYNARLLEADQRIVDTDVAYADRYVHKLLVTSEGSCIRQEAGYCQAVLAASARSGENIQRAFEVLGDTRGGYRNARLIADRVDAVARRAVELLSAPRVRAGRYPVVLDPRLAGVFIHEAFGHLSEADHICENPQARAMMVLGRKFAPDFFNVYDDATLEGQWGSHAYDDEGVRAAPTVLIAQGRLSGRLHNRYTAARLGEQPTGNACAINYQHAPIVRMTNTYVAPGRSGLRDLLGPIKEGVYACGMFGGQTMLEDFSFSAAHGRMIRNGELAEPVRDIVLSGNLFKTLASITAVGDDMQMHSGGCGKGGQSPKPVGIGAPHMAIDNVLIGGGV